MSNNQSSNVPVQGAVDLSHLADRNKAKTPAMNSIPLEQRQQLWDKEQRILQMWTAANQPVLRNVIETDIARNMYYTLSCNEMMQVIIEKIGINPNRINNQMAAAIFKVINRAINYGVYKGAELAGTGNLLHVTLPDERQIPLPTPEAEKLAQEMQAQPETKLAKAEVAVPSNIPATDDKYAGRDKLND